MTTALIIFCLSTVLSVIFTKSVMGIATRYGLVDYPDQHRKTHRQAVPRLGGVGVFVAASLSLGGVIAFLPDNLVVSVFRSMPRELWGLGLGGSAVFAMGLYDDLRSLRARWKLLVQAIAATIAFAAGYAIVEVKVPFGSTLELGVWSYPLTLFWFIGCMNAVNLIDGLDGLAAGVTMLVSITMLLVSLVLENVVCMVLSACMAGSVLGFLFYNFHPARIFLGDSGSMLLGFWVAAISIIGSRTAETAVSMVVPLVALGLPILDTSLVIARRWSEKLPLSAPDRRHIHHSLIAMGMSHKRAVLVLYLVCITFGAMALLVSFERSEVALVVLGSLAIIVFVCIRVLGGLRMEALVHRVSSNFRQGRDDAWTRAHFERITSDVESADNIDEAWVACAALFDILGLCHVELRISDNVMRGSEEPRSLVWETEANSLSESLGTDHWSCELALDDNLGVLHADTRVTAGRFTSTTPELLTRLRVILSKRVSSLQPSPDPSMPDLNMAGAATVSAGDSN